MASSGKNSLIALVSTFTIARSSGPLVGTSLPLLAPAMLDSLNSASNTTSMEPLFAEILVGEIVTVGRIDGVIVGCVDGGTDDDIDGSVDGSIDGGIDGGIDGCADGDIDGGIDGGIDNSIDG